MEDLQKTFKIISNIYARFVSVGVHWSLVLSASGRKKGSGWTLVKLDLNDNKKVQN